MKQSRSPFTPLRSLALAGALSMMLAAACTRPTYSGSEPPAMVTEAITSATANGKPILFDLYGEN